MSLILKGIDLPKGKDEALLLLILGDGTVAEKISSNRYEEMTDTEAIQIPKGARLIDANAMLKDLRRRICNRVPVYKDEDVDVYITELVKEIEINNEIRTLREWILSQPVILESEVMPNE